MKAKTFNLMRYDADEGFVFDWKEPRYQDVYNEEGKATGEKEQYHLNAKTIFIGEHDNIDNYIEVKAGGEA